MCSGQADFWLSCAVRIPMSPQPAICAKWQPATLRCHQRTMIEDIYCSLVYPQLGLPETHETKCSRCLWLIIALFFELGQRVNMFSFMPLDLFSALPTSFFFFGTFNHHLFNTTRLLFFLFFLLFSLFSHLSFHSYVSAFTSQA